MPITPFQLPSRDTTYLDRQLLDGDGRIKLLPASAFQVVPAVDLMVWCHRRARYGLPTLELVEWLRERIAGRAAIEVGAGNGDLGWHLGIPMSDSRIQTAPQMQFIYSQMRQPPTNPRPDVATFEANAAVRRLRPKVVVASWLTRKFVRGVDDKHSNASFHGTWDEKIIAEVETYIHVGNLDSHSDKTALSIPHETLQFPWLVSRALQPQNNVIYIWDKKYRA